MAVLQPTLLRARPLTESVRRLSLGIGFVVLGLASGCKNLMDNQQLPAGTTDPSVYHTKQGALQERNAAVLGFLDALLVYIPASGLLTDELQDITVGASPGQLLSNRLSVSNPLDERLLPEGRSTGASVKDGGNAYYLLQRTRGLVSQALGMLATYDTAAADLTSQRMLRAELHALNGYTEVLLADLFCSGVPLSTLDFERDFTYRAGSTTAEVYQTALAQFDTALALADTSTLIQNLARVGRGRAWLDLGAYDSAAVAVQKVPDGFVYRLSSTTTGTLSGLGATVSDQEGGTGLPFLSSGDPRSVDQPAGFVSIENSTDSIPKHWPRKYSDNSLPGAVDTLTVASGVEARLIVAEQALHAGQVATWLTDLNTLRTAGSVITTGDTSWLAGTGGVAGLPPLTDPGSDSARVALQFRERAEWLYVTGSRQGDLRRQLRQYSQYWGDPSTLYPTGLYLGEGTGLYGTDVTAPIPVGESVNPLFHGCLNRAP